MLLKSPIKTFPGIKYYAFLDGEPQLVFPWNLKLFSIPVKNPVFEVRRIKTLPHRWWPDEDAWTWCDGNMQLKINPANWLKENDIEYITLAHYKRNNIIDEAKEILKIKKAPPEMKEVLEQQIADYAAEGFKSNILSIGGFSIRRNTPAIREFNDLWWEQIQKYPHGRDQMSLDYCLWKCKIKVFRVKNTTWHNNHLWRFTPWWK